MLNREALLSANKSNYAAIEGEGTDCAGALRRGTRRPTSALPSAMASRRSWRAQGRSSGSGGGGMRRRRMPPNPPSVQGTRRRGLSLSLPASSPTELIGRLTASAPRSPAWPGQIGRALCCWVPCPISTCAALARPRPCRCRSGALSRTWMPCPSTQTTWMANCQTGTTKSVP